MSIIKEEKFQKQELYSIGEISRATGIGIKSLKYYEDIDIISPVHIEKESGYRYYSLKQTYWLTLIQMAVDLGVPLKNLRQYLGEYEEIDYKSFTDEMKVLVKERITELESGLQFIDAFNEDLELMTKHKKDIKPYVLNLTEKYFYITPCEVNSSPLSLRKKYGEMIKYLSKNNQQGMFWDCGQLFLFEGDEIRRFAYVQISNGISGSILSPTGEYYCLQSPASQIENAQDIFKGVMDNSKYSLVIEMDIFANNSSYLNPGKELRIIQSPIPFSSRI